MSSTNRGTTRAEHDYYVTPVSHIVRFLEAFKVDCFPDSYPKTVLDSCAGGDETRPMSYPTALAQVWPKAKVVTCDIREDSRAEYKQDYLTTELSFKPKLIISNPPFSLAREFITKALQDVADDGYVVMLLRLNYFGSQQRKKFWHTHMPVYAYVHAKRMTFVQSGSTDSIEYMHCVWQKNLKPLKTQLSII